MSAVVESTGAFDGESLLGGVAGVGNIDKKKKGKGYVEEPYL